MLDTAGVTLGFIVLVVIVASNLINFRFIASGRGRRH